MEGNMRWQQKLCCWNKGFVENLLSFWVVMLVAGSASTSHFGHQREGSLSADSASSYLLAQSPAGVKKSANGARGPHFLINLETKRNVTTTVDQTAYLHCHVAELGDTAVSWIRKRDLHVLSSGQVVFASDQRFQVLHPIDSDEWTLQIKYAQRRDAGVYECQVNTEPKISRSYFLNVVESRARIFGPEYVKAGSAINLTCVVNQPSTQSPVYWYHNKEILDYEGLVSTNTGTNGEPTTSHLTITKATTKHSGNYTCWPTSAQPASAVVNVVEEGEQPAAMQTGRASSISFKHEIYFLQGLLQIVVYLELHLQCDPMRIR
ncbi:zwei Ig domain protein zig-8-like isoform X2 [Palaemon carinicauda]|uniref:zwei Ig domain protein zig-8-like isoform X2 n=1 Tax=Palaemon carinicauda TaxID=392227 RepID=UPI0035B62CE4